MEDEIKIFMENHGMTENGDAKNYHIALSFYYAYSVDAYRLAEQLENGEVFDEYEISAIIKSLILSHETVRHFQKKLQLPVDQFDTSETVCFMKSSLSKARITGDVENAVDTAKKWLRRYHSRNSPGNSESSATKQDFFLYETALFILYVTGKEIDYRFLEQKQYDNPVGSN